MVSVYVYVRATARTIPACPVTDQRKEAYDACTPPWMPVKLGAFQQPFLPPLRALKLFLFFNKKMWEGGRYCVATSHEDAGILEASRGSFGFVCVCSFKKKKKGWLI